MRVGHRFMTVQVRVLDSGSNGRRMVMLVMIVMIVFVGMLKRFVLMLMLVPLRDVQPHAQAHQRAGNQQLKCRRFSHADNGDQRAGKGRC